MSTHRSSFNFDLTDVPTSFALVEKPDQARKELARAFENGAPAAIWLRGQKDLLKSRCSFESDVRHSLIVEVPPGNDWKAYSEKIRSEADEAFLISAIKDGGLIGFKARFLSSSAKGFVFEPPKMVFKAQRRKDKRIDIPKGYDVTVSFPDPANLSMRKTRPLLDLSVKGMAFGVNSDEAPLFKTGMILRNILLVIRNRTLHVDAEIRGQHLSRNSKRGDQVSVGVKFYNVDEMDQDFLATYIAEYAIQYLSR